MGGEIYHHGIKGMKWGIRRTPEQLGHAVAKKSPDRGKKPVKTPGKALRKSTSISDDELKRRIERLNMEERYEDLLARKKVRDTPGWKRTRNKLIGEALEGLGKGLLTVAKDKLLERITGFDIDKYKDMDIKDMDADTVAKVAKWWGDAMKIDTARNRLKPAESKSDKDSSDSKPDKASSDSESKTGGSGEGSSDSGSSRTITARNLPRIYRSSGTRYKKEAERIARDRRNRDRDVLKWLI